MKEIPLKPKSEINPLPYILLAGSVIGIVIGWMMFSSPPNQARIPAQPTGTMQVLSGQTPTPSIQIVSITPVAKNHVAAAVGDPVPDFSLFTLDGQKTRLSDYLGKPILINLWATWCPPCRYEMPGIEAAYQAHKDSGLVVLGIDFTAQDNLNEVKAFVAEMKLTFPILLDETGEVSAGTLGMRGLPTSYFIDRTGILRRIQVGAMLPEKIEEYLQDIIVK